MANGCVPWPGPVPAPGASNMVMVDSAPTKGVSRNFRKPLPVPLEAVGARTPKSKLDVSAAASRRAGVKMTPLLRNIFRRILVLIRYLSFRDYLCLFRLQFSFCNHYGDVIQLLVVRINDHFWWIWHDHFEDTAPWNFQPYQH